MAVFLYAGGFVFPDGNAAAHRVVANARILRKLDHQVIFLGTSDTVSGFDPAAAPRHWEGFSYYEYPYPDSLARWIGHTTAFAELFHVLKKHPEIEAVVAYNLPSVALLRLHSYCRRHRIKLINDITEWYVVKTGSLLMRTCKNLDSALRMRFASFLADGILVISRYLENHYKDKNTARLPPLVDRAAQKWPDRVPQPEGPREFTTYGIANRNKEYLGLLLESLRSFKESHPFKLNVLGVTEDEMLGVFPEYRQLFMDLRTNIVFFGRISNARCIEIINRSHFMIFIRYANRVTQAGFPTKFVESISSGTPVITNRTGDLADYYGRAAFLGILIGETSRAGVDAALKEAFDMDEATIRTKKEACLSSGLFHYEEYAGRLRELLDRAGINTSPPR